MAYFFHKGEAPVRKGKDEFYINPSNTFLREVEKREENEGGEKKKDKGK